MNDPETRLKGNQILNLQFTWVDVGPGHYYAVQPRVGIYPFTINHDVHWSRVKDANKFGYWMPYSVVNGKIVTYHPYTGTIHNGKVMRVSSLILAKICKPPKRSILHMQEYQFLLDYLGSIQEIAQYFPSTLDSSQFDPNFH